MAILLALGSGLIIGVADIFGSLAGRAGRVLAPSMWMLLFGAPGLMVLGVVLDGDLIARDMAIGAVAGLASALALLLLYTGYSRTSIGIVAPTVAVVSAAVPVSVGIIVDGAPSTIAVIGIIVGLAAIVLIGWAPDPTTADKNRLAVVLGIGSGIGFGVMAVLLGFTSQDAGVWPALATRLIAAATLAVGGLVMKRPHLPYANTWKFIVPAAVLASVGIALFTLSAQRDVTIAGLLVQSAFAVTIIGGVILYGERSSVSQRVGFVAGAAALIFISVG